MLIGLIPVLENHSFAETTALSIPSESGLPGVEDRKSLNAIIDVFLDFFSEERGLGYSVMGAIWPFAPGQPRPSGQHSRLPTRKNHGLSRQAAADPLRSFRAGLSRP